MTDDAVGYEAATRWTWRERLKGFLFPPDWAPCPMPTRFKAMDVVTCRTAVSLSLRARVMVLLSGCLWVETRTATEHEVGQSETTSAAYPTWNFR